jgi:SAM-dependent methyltransferase
LKSALERVSDGEAVAQRAEPAATAVPTDLPARREEVSASQPPISLDALPFPPLEMRELIGTADLAAFDNPAGSLVYDYIDSNLYEKVFDFGCGCGRVARQLLQQRPAPKMYVGIDLHAGMIRWCQRNLQPVAPHFSFLHHDVFDVMFNPIPGSPSVAPFPVGDSQFTLVNAHSVFTHLTEEQAPYYLRECVRILTSDGVLHASWFLFDKQDHPMMHEHHNALYLSYQHPGAAVLFDKQWVKDTAHAAGLRICAIIPPWVRGHQWVVMMTRRQDVQEPEFPSDDAPRGWVRPPMGSGRHPSTIGDEP